MKALSVEYRRLVSIPGTYENIAVGLVLGLEGDQTIQSALEAAEQVVNNELSRRLEDVGVNQSRSYVLRGDLNALEMEIASARRTKEALEAEVATLKARYDKAREFLHRFGVESREFEDSPL